MISCIDDLFSRGCGLVGGIFLRSSRFLQARTAYDPARFPPGGHNRSHYILVSSRAMHAFHWAELVQGILE